MMTWHASYDTDSTQVPVPPGDHLSDDNFKSRAKAGFGQVVQYALLDSCRRRFLLAHFGEKLPLQSVEGGGGERPVGCGGCDACHDPKVWGSKV